MVWLAILSVLIFVANLDCLVCDLLSASIWMRPDPTFTLTVCLDHGDKFSWCDVYIISDPLDEYWILKGAAI